MPTLERINVTPVKGMALHHPVRIEITPQGIPGDRRFYMVDESGRVVSGSTFGPLVTIVPTYDPRAGSLSLRFPDGTEVSDETDQLGEVETTDFYGRPVAAHSMNGPWNEALSAFVRKPVRLLRCDRDGDGFDVQPLTVVSTASVRDLAKRGRRPDSLDSRRFRINLELEGCEPYDEDSWDGHSVGIGDVQVRVQGAIPRCVVTTQDPDAGTKDWDTLTQIAKYRPRIKGDGGLPFGMYATVVQPGVAHVGDAVQVQG
jgi:uncharacterized protein YcbX